MKLCVHQASTADRPWGKCPTHSQWKTVLYTYEWYTASKCKASYSDFLQQPLITFSVTPVIYIQQVWKSRWLWSSCKCNCVCVTCNPWTSATADVDFMPSCLLSTIFTSDLLLFVPSVRHLKKPTGGWFPPFSGSPHSLMARKGIFVDILFYWLPLQSSRTDFRKEEVVS